MDESQQVRECRQNQDQQLQLMHRYCLLANYLSAAQLYLKDNFLLKEPLHVENVKERLLGHWGTCPGLNFIYAHLNRLIKSHKLSLCLLTGPGHGAPAIFANLFLEGSLNEFYPRLTLDYEGVGRFCKAFSWPEGFPSHLYPGVPGTIHEGGELGYSLGTAFGAVMDNPDLIAACIVGDGEAESGPTAAAWHSYKFLDPAESGAVLPILHLNGYKISNPTIYGSLSDDELRGLFYGYGYQVRIVQNSDLHADMWCALDWAIGEIQKIQGAARSGNRIAQPRFPIIILRSPKGWGGIQNLGGQRIEGSYRSHQIPAKDLRSNLTSLSAVEDWLRSYLDGNIFAPNGSPSQELLALCPEGGDRIGLNVHTFGAAVMKPLNMPDVDALAVSVTGEKDPQGVKRGGNHASSMAVLGNLLAQIVSNNPQNFRIFCPDELESNLLGNVFKVTHRNYQWPIPEDDRNHTQAEGGRVLEILSEHCLQSWLQGYLLTGRHGFFASYEAFLPIVATMTEQYFKFIKCSQDIPWRHPVPSMIYLETSTLWRQEHNGFSHQSPQMINTLLNMRGSVVRIHLPPDTNTLLATMDSCFRERGAIELVIANKSPLPQWLSIEEAKAHCRAGASTWSWAGSYSGIAPEVVLVGIGDIPHVEVMAAAQMLKESVPELRFRVVNVTDLSIFLASEVHPRGLNRARFNSLFTPSAPVIVNFHGYPSAVEQLLFERHVSDRFLVNGYLEEGATTTPFDMCVRNKISRYHLVIQVLELASKHNTGVAARANELIAHYEYILQEHKKYIVAYGKDPQEIEEWRWLERS